MEVIQNDTSPSPLMEQEPHGSPNNEIDVTQYETPSSPPMEQEPHDCPNNMVCLPIKIPSHKMSSYIIFYNKLQRLTV